jgi:hypothetical protein
MLTAAQSAVGVGSAAHDVDVYAASATGDDHSPGAGAPYPAALAAVASKACEGSGWAKGESRMT